MTPNFIDYDQITEYVYKYDPDNRLVHYLLNPIGVTYSQLMAEVDKLGYPVATKVIHDMAKVIEPAIYDNAIPEFKVIKEFVSLSKTLQGLEDLIQDYTGIEKLLKGESDNIFLGEIHTDRLARLQLLHIMAAPSIPSGAVESVITDCIGKFAATDKAKVSGLLSSAIIGGSLYDQDTMDLVLSQLGHDLINTVLVYNHYLNQFNNTRVISLEANHIAVWLASASTFPARVMYSKVNELASPIRYILKFVTTKQDRRATKLVSEVLSNILAIVSAGTIYSLLVGIPLRYPTNESRWSEELYKLTLDSVYGNLSPTEIAQIQKRLYEFSHTDVRALEDKLNAISIVKGSDTEPMRVFAPILKTAFDDPTAGNIISNLVSAIKNDHTNRTTAITKASNKLISMSVGDSGYVELAEIVKYLKTGTQVEILYSKYGDLLSLCNAIRTYLQELMATKIADSIKVRTNYKYSTLIQKIRHSTTNTYHNAVVRSIVSEAGHTKKPVLDGMNCPDPQIQAARLLLPKAIKYAKDSIRHYRKPEAFSDFDSRLQNAVIEITTKDKKKPVRSVPVKSITKVFKDIKVKK